MRFNQRLALLRMVKPVPDSSGDRPGIPGFAVERRYPPYADHTVDQKQLVGNEQFIDADGRYPDWNVIDTRELYHPFALHAGDSAARKIRHI